MTDTTTAIVTALTTAKPARTALTPEERAARKARRAARRTKRIATLERRLKATDKEGKPILTGTAQAEALLELARLRNVEAAHATYGTRKTA